ncbi:MAG TPA: YlbF family regulator [Gemmatimonadaceae bacterium]|nr:YlbF family regulator [Gemmatimonadaceae bacterium]
MNGMHDKATELGRLIGQSSEYQLVRRANEQLSANAEAVALLERLEQLRRDAQELIEQGAQPTPDMEESLDALLAEVQGNPICQNLIVAQENFNKVMTRVNEWILDGIRKGAASPIITLG